MAKYVSLFSLAWRGISALALTVVSLPTVNAETGYDAWLRYAPIHDEAVRQSYAMLPAVIVALDDGPIIRSAQAELVRGVRGFLGKELQVQRELSDNAAFVLGTDESMSKIIDMGSTDATATDLNQDGFAIKSCNIDGKQCLVIAGDGERGVLYGVFALLRVMSMERPVEHFERRESPYAPIRILNHWDNLNGTIERGYAGRSIFWEDDHVLKDLSRVRDYARLMASMSINGCSINNVNADARVVTAEYLPEMESLTVPIPPGLFSRPQATTPIIPSGFTTITIR